MSVCGGGPAANAAVAVARLGGTAAFCGYLGNDSFGDAHLAELHAEGVDCTRVVRGPTSTPLACVVVKPDGCRSIVDHREPAVQLAENAATLGPRLPDVLLLDGHQPLLSSALLAEARRHGIPTVLDAGSVHDGTRLLYNAVDYLIASEKFTREMSQESDPRLALAALDGAAPVIAATWGADGVYFQDESGQHHLPTFDIEPVDTTGAGDAFHGAFALGLARGLKLRQNFRQACAVGALTCMGTGARPALPRRPAVEALLGALSDGA